MIRDLDERLTTALNRSGIMVRYATALHNVLNNLFQQTILRPLKLFSNGTWLLHPLHPVITDVPIGSWTGAMVLDLAALLFGIPNLGLANAILIGLGTLAGLGAIATGLMDFMDIDLTEPLARQQKNARHPALALAVTHGTVNILATILFAVSLFTRWGSNWAITWTNFIPALIGYLLVTVGGFLGGSLVFRLGTMVNRNAYRTTSKQLKPVVSIRLEDLRENTPHRVEINGDPVMLIRRGNQVYGVGAVCSHYGAALDQGEIKHDTIVCPYHYSRFSILDGSIKEGPTTAPIPVYDVEITEGKVIVRTRKELD